MKYASILLSLLLTITCFGTKINAESNGGRFKANKVDNGSVIDTVGPREPKCYGDIYDNTQPSGCREIVGGILTDAEVVYLF